MNRTINAICDVLEGKKITLVDVGASGGINNRWNKFKGILQVVGFEPNEKEFQKLKDGSNYTWLNVALGSREEKRKLYITAHESNVSIYPPNYPLLNQLQWTSDPNPVADFNIIERIEITCKKLDEVLFAVGVRPDFLKVDTQGSELNVLRGAVRLLSEDFVLVEVEVEFVPIYENQPLFADVDIFMRQFGYILQDIGNILYMKPRGFSGKGGPKGRIISADALYMKDIHSQCEAIYSKGIEKVCAVLIGYLSYGYPEFCLTFLNELYRRGFDFPNHDRICQELSRINHRSTFWAYLPGRHRLLRFARKISSKLRDVEHYFLNAKLGNDLNL